jgi:hypothetical protein
MSSADAKNTSVTALNNYATTLRKRGRADIAVKVEEFVSTAGSRLFSSNERPTDQEVASIEALGSFIVAEVDNPNVRKAVSAPG